MGFADVALDAAGLLLAGWLGWLLVAALGRRWVPVLPPYRWRTGVVAGVGIAVLLNLAQAAVLDSVEDRSGVSRLDQPMLNWMLGHRSADLTLFAKTVSAVGSTMTWAVVTAVVTLWLSWQRRWLDAALLAVAAGGAALLVTVSKQILGRSRPPVVDRLVVETNQSLPSGHALGSLVVIGMLTALLLSRVTTMAARTTALLTAAVAVFLIGWSRLYLGVHWSTDVLDGWLLGAAWLTVCLTVLTALSHDPLRRSAGLPESSTGAR